LQRRIPRTRNLVLALAGAGLLLGASPPREPVIGGPCEGCEHVFEGQPPNLASRARIAPATAAGEPLVIEGTVRTLAGAVAPGIVIYAYHTDAGGIYPRASTPHGALRGWVRTDATGSYRFDTIRPGAYPGRSVPQHVHMHVIEPGRATYYIDDIVFSDDPLLSAERRRTMMRGRGGDGFSEAVRDGGTWHVRRDITLGKNIPAHPGR